MYMYLTEGGVYERSCLQSGKAADYIYHHPSTYIYVTHLSRHSGWGAYSRKFVSKPHPLPFQAYGMYLM